MPQGIALLVAGAPSVGAARLGASSVQTLGQIGEALLATGAPWRIRRLSAGAGDRNAPDRANLKRFIDELAQPADVAMLVVAAEIAATSDGPAIVTGHRHREYPSEATLPLAWIRARLRTCAAERLLVLLTARVAEPAAVSAAEWLEAMTTGRPGDVVAVDVSSDAARALDALLAGLCGEALDPGTGTITMRSIGQHLAGAVPGIALHPSLVSETLAVSPPLGGLWTVRASEVHRAAARPPTEEEPVDLTGVVLPGRFRIEEELASGSFGTVYCARQLTVQRDVAVKVLHAGIDPTSEDGRLFVHEIESVGRIDHANVVRIYQADITSTGRLFFAMELLIGRDLQAIIEDGVLPQARAVGLVRQLLAGLGAAHEAGLVHADVKPANAFVVPGKEGERLVLLDFGLARLRRSGSHAESAGGTPAYMAPEQLREGRVDARSDLFSAALVLLTLLTGWRRRTERELAPPLDGVVDPALRAVLARALSLDPADRFQNAADLADALAGNAPRSPSQASVLRTPFRRLAPFTERDRGRLHGRERDIADLTESVLYRRSVIYTAPSGVGKTSLLRAGLVPHLESLGVRVVYLACRPGAAPALASAIRPGAADVAEAIATWHDEHRGRLVLILDQVEALLTERQEGEAADLPDLIGELSAFDRWPADADVSVVLSVREDFLARLLCGWRIDDGAILRLGPLSAKGAHAAITGPLAEERLGIDEELLGELLRDLAAAARAIAPAMGWGQTAAAYPPHLQLACSVLYEALGPGEATLTPDHYRRLGGFDAIVGEHLDRVLDSQLDPAAAQVARELFLALVTTYNTRALRSEADLLDIVGARHGLTAVATVLDALRAEGLVVRLRATGGEPSWELIHDSLVPRVLAWVDRRGLDHRRALELIRYHVRRSKPDSPSLFSRAELRELRSHRDALDELEAETKRRRDVPWTPAALVARSRRALRIRDGAVLAASLAVAAMSGVGVQRCGAERELRNRDMGRFVLQLVPFDLDPAARSAVLVPVAELSLDWSLRQESSDDPDEPGAPMADQFVVRGDPIVARDGKSRIEEAEARGGRAYLVVDGRGRPGEECPPSIVPLRLPGYAQRDRKLPPFVVRVPTCRASMHDMIEIPAGPFIRGGIGEAPPLREDQRDDVAPESMVHEPRFFIDRTEVTNEEFKVFEDMSEVTGVGPVPDLRLDKEHDYCGDKPPNCPVVGIHGREARAYCRFLGKDLPTASQWEKAARGGLRLANGELNPYPRRNVPWDPTDAPVPAKLRDTGRPGAAPVGTFPGDKSPYGVLDMAGNVAEWTATAATLNGQPAPGFWVTRGGYWSETTTENLLDFMIDNQRPADSRLYALGMRCVLNGPAVVR